MKTQKLTTKGYTMNGIPFEEAEKMVLNFLAKRHSPDSMTSIWFPTAFVIQILVEKEKNEIDGVRFYFAKKDGQNTVVPVATKIGKMSPLHGRYRHDDFFFSDPVSRFDPERDYTERGPYANACVLPDCNLTMSSVPCALAIKWAKAFRDDHISEDEDQFINTTSVWYGIKFFERLGRRLEAAAENNLVKPDGIRLYFIRNDHRQDGFIFFNTYENDKGEHIEDPNCYPIHEIFNLKGTGTTADDRGEECPIFCPGTTWNDSAP